MTSFAHILPDGNEKEIGGSTFLMGAVGKYCSAHSDCLVSNHHYSMYSLDGCTWISAGYGSIGDEGQM